MFERITISRVPTSRRARIAFTLLKPRGWHAQRVGDGIVLAPAARRDSGFAVLMPNNENENIEKVLRDADGLITYFERTLPGMHPMAMLDEEDDASMYELVMVRGRIEGVPGRVIAYGTAVAVEDVNFALVGFARDEEFHKLHHVFRAIVNSFQPLVTG